jgi:hypothetical protein
VRRTGTDSPEEPFVLQCNIFISRHISWIPERSPRALSEGKLWLSWPASLPPVPLLPF